MKSKGIVLKLGLIIMALFLSILIPFAIWIDRVFINVYSLYLNENVKAIAERVETEVSEGGRSLDSMYLDLTVFFDHEILLFNENGHITAGDFMGFYQGQHLPDEWIQRLLEGEELEGERYNPSRDENFYFVVHPIMEEGSMTSGIMIYSSIDELHDKMHVVRDWIIRAIIATILIAVAYTFFVVWYVSRPLIVMEKATRQIAKGNLDTKVTITTNDELGSLANAINDLSSELNRYRKTRSEFLADISHELRTPTSYLIGYAQLIKQGRYKDSEQLEHYSGVIEGEAERLAKLIDDLFELSKMEDGHYSLEFQEIDLIDFVDTLETKVAWMAKNKGLLFYVHQELRDDRFFTDGRRLEQILLNLLENAIHYTDQGEVTLTVDMKEQRIHFLIKDTGAGIPQEELPHIFERFYRVDKSRTRSTGGTGLGLSIVSELVKQLGGSISVSSEEKKGTTFDVSFPYSAHTKKATP